jgi:branched-chain amino acid transport system permease protein
MQLTTRARPRTLPQVLAILLALAVVPLLGLGPRLEEVLTLAMIYAVAAVALDLFAGYSGQFSFGQFAFVGIGAYAATVLRGAAGVPLMPALLGAMASCAIVALVIGLAMVRLPHLGSALTTFFLAFVAVNAFSSHALSTWTGGSNGLYVPPSTILGWPLAVGRPLYYAAWVVLLVTAWLTSRYVNSRAGRALQLIKQSELVASIVGVSVHRAKLSVFVFAAVAAGVAGVLLSLQVGYLAPESFPPTESITLFAMVAIGGFGTLAGPILGALFFTIVPELFLGAGATRAILFSLAFLASLIFVPGGLYSLVGERPTRRRDTVAAHRPAGLPCRPACAGYSGDVLIDANRVSVRFGETMVLKNASLQVRAGTVHAVIGPNGAGKTTFLNCISGIQPMSGGRIALKGQDISRDPPERRCRRGMARTFQHPALVQDLTVIDNVRLGLYGRERGLLLEDLLWSPRAARRDALSSAQAHASLDRIGFPYARRGVLAAELTLAEQKLVDIARALAGEPRAVLLDEPTAGLSEQEIETIAEAIRQTRHAELAIVVIAHHVGFVSAIADCVTVLHLGEVLAEGTPPEITASPAVREVFLGT